MDDQELHVGDSLHDKINEGLAKSRFGVVILSPSFLSKKWPKLELAAMMALEEDGHKIILPVWHGIDKKALSSYSPVLVDRVAANTGWGIEQVAKAIARVVILRQNHDPSDQSQTVAFRLIELLEKKPTIKSLRNFLAIHDWIVESALWGSRPRYFVERADDWKQWNYRPDFTAHYLHHSALTYYYTALFLESSTARLFTKNGEPTTTVHKAVERYKGFRDKWNRINRPRRGPYTNNWRPRILEHGTIVIGRRDNLTLEDRKYLSDYSRSLRKIKLYIRTYDWLVEIAVNGGMHNNGR